jgi:hypothetical protein
MGDENVDVDVMGQFTSALLQGAAACEQDDMDEHDKDKGKGVVCLIPTCDAIWILTR